MQCRLAIICIFFSVTGFAQVGQKTHPDSTFSLVVPAKLSENELYGNISLGLGYCHSTYKLNNDHTFQEIFGCCLGDSVVAEGKWELVNGHTLILKFQGSAYFSKDSIYKFTIASLKSEYYFIPESQEMVTLKKFEDGKRKYYRILRRKGQLNARLYLREELLGGCYN